MKTKYEVMGDRPFLLVPVIDERLEVSPLDARGTLVYGYLLYLARKGTGASRTRIATSLRMDKKAVDRVVGILMDGGTAVEEGQTVKAVEPTGGATGWFRLLKEPTSGAWYERFIYDRVYLPRSYTAISVNANALYWHLVRLGFPVAGMPGYLQVGGHAEKHPKYLTVNYLAKALRVYRKTVKRSLTALQELDLVRVECRTKKRLVCGLPPIDTKVGLWREAWRRTGQADSAVTAESLFGLPSNATLEPSTLYDAGAGRYIRAFGIRGKVAEEIVTKIVKHRIEKQKWQPMLEEARRDHEANREKNPGQYRVEHCGHLFIFMLNEHLQAKASRRGLSRGISSGGLSEPKAEAMLQDLRVTKDMRILLHHALDSEHLQLRGGGCVPCRLHWDDVLAVLMAARGDFEAFRKGVATFIFTLGKDPQCDWYDAWMSMKQIPALNDAPLKMLGLDSRQRGFLQEHAKLIARRKLGDDDQVARNELVNNLIRLGCWQATGRSSSAIEASISDISRVLFGEQNDEQVVVESPAADEWRRKLEGVRVWG